MCYVGFLGLFVFKQSTTYTYHAKKKVKGLATEPCPRLVCDGVCHNGSLV